MKTLINIQNITKRYSGHTALNKVSLTIPEGSLFGLLGPNGAGKTSLIRIITNITYGDEGTILIDQIDSKQISLGTIGYMPEERGLYKKMKVAEQLEYLCELRGIPKNEAKKRIKYWLEKLQIEKWYNKKIEELSKGMQQKIQFISTILHQPKILILDEPFSGLDPVNADLIKEEIYNLNKQGTTIIFSTHRMEQVEEICNKIAIINQGKCIVEDSVNNLKQIYKENLYHVTFQREINPNHVDHNIELVQISENKVLLKSHDISFINQLIQSEIKNQNYIINLSESLPSLNQIFIKAVSITD